VADHPKTLEQNYLKKLLAMAADKPASLGARFIDIEHDDWCDHIIGQGYCNCDPYIPGLTP
jgi:hypothetical protein